MIRLALAMSVLLHAGLAHAEDTRTCVQAANVGQQLRDTGQLSQARAAFLTCSAASCPAVVRQECERWVGEVDARMPTIVLGAKSESGEDLAVATVAIDGKVLEEALSGRAIPLDPGRHEIVVEAAEHRPTRVQIVTREGEHLRSVMLTLPSLHAAKASTARPVATPIERRRDVTVLAIAGALAGVGFTGFGVLGALGQAEKDELANSCASSRNCDAAEVSAARTKLILADVSLGLGIAAAGVFTVFALVPTKKVQQHARLRDLHLGVAPSTTGVVGALSFAY